jgi:hypothetical protein
MSIRRQMAVLDAANFFAFARADSSEHGLHHGINMIREICGEVSAESDGPGTEAAFKITVPGAVHRPQRSADRAPEDCTKTAFNDIDPHEKAEQSA